MLQKTASNFSFKWLQNKITLCTPLDCQLRCTGNESSTHTHTAICMFRVKWRRHWLIPKSSFSRQCIGRICDTCSQLTRNSHSSHTHGGTFWPTLTPAQTLYLHESCLNKPKSEVCKKATSPFEMSVASSSVIFMIHTASWYETYVHVHTHTHTSVYWSSFQMKQDLPVKPGFHYPSWRVTGFHYPSTRAMLTGARFH